MRRSLFVVGLSVGLFWMCGSAVAGGSCSYQQGDYAAAYAEYQAAADQGDAEAQYFLGVMHVNGEGVPSSPATAADWFRKAAEQGHTLARYRLGLLHYTGRGVPVDFSVAALSAANNAAENNPASPKRLIFSMACITTSRLESVA